MGCSSSNPGEGSGFRSFCAGLALVAGCAATVPPERTGAEMTDEEVARAQSVIKAVQDAVNEVVGDCKKVEAVSDFFVVGDKYPTVMMRYFPEAGGVRQCLADISTSGNVELASLRTPEQNADKEPASGRVWLGGYVEGGLSCEFVEAGPGTVYVCTDDNLYESCFVKGDVVGSRRVGVDCGVVRLMSPGKSNMVEWARNLLSSILKDVAVFFRGKMGL